MKLGSRVEKSNVSLDGALGMGAGWLFVALLPNIEPAKLGKKVPDDSFRPGLLKESSILISIGKSNRLEVGANPLV